VFHSYRINACGALYIPEKMAERDLLANIGKLSDQQVLTDMMRLLPMVEDGHTEVIPMLCGQSKWQLHYLPLAFKVSDDGIYIRTAKDPALEYIVGYFLLGGR
jgi:hypothetical protein